MKPNPVEQVKMVDSPECNIRGIAWSGRHLWISVIDKNLILQLDGEMMVLASYRPIILDAWYQLIENVDMLYLSFDFNNRLWAVTQEGICEFQQIQDNTRHCVSQKARSSN
ncbi:hypothetical protein JXJ21_10225 [candidate division KSB1 bacterium]|nr:hypothetical protein [candidate division KSB1 bacterium]